jgi:hypothetical protein
MWGPAIKGTAKAHIRAHPLNPPSELSAHPFSPSTVSGKIGSSVPKTIRNRARARQTETRIAAAMADEQQSRMPSAHSYIGEKLALLAQFLRRRLQRRGAAPPPPSSPRAAEAPERERLPKGPRRRWAVRRRERHSEQRAAAAQELAAATRPPPSPQPPPPPPQQQQTHLGVLGRSAVERALHPGGGGGGGGGGQLHDAALHPAPHRTMGEVAVSAAGGAGGRA